LCAPTTVIAPLFSRRSAEAFASLLRSLRARAAQVIVFGISAHALDVPGAPWDVAIASPEPNSAAIAEAVIQFLATQRRAA
jgi:hypothetical protein